MNDAQADALFNSLIAHLNTFSQDTLRLIAEEHAATIKEYLKGNIDRTNVLAALGSDELVGILDNYKNYNTLSATQPDNTTATIVSSSATTADYDDFESGSAVGIITEDAVTESVSTIGSASEPPGHESESSYVWVREPDTSVTAYSVANLIGAVGGLGEAATNPGQNRYLAPQLLQQSIDSNLPAISKQMRDLDATMLTDGFTKMLIPLVGEDRAPGLAQSLGFIPQALSVINTPAIKNQLKARAPKLAETLEFLEQVTTGGIGTATELNMSLNGGRYGAGAAEAVSGLVNSVIKSEAVTKGEVTPRQVTATVDYLKENARYSPEGVMGVTRAKTRERIVDESLSPDKEEELLKLFAENYIKENSKADEEEVYKAFRTALVSNDTRYFANDKGETDSTFIAFQGSVEDARKDYLAAVEVENRHLINLTKARRRVAQSAFSVLSNETQQKLIQESGGNQEMAEMKAADMMLGMYGGYDLEQGNFQGAAEQIQYILHTAQLAGIGEKDLEAQAQAVGTALGQENVALMPQVIEASLLVQKDLYDRGIHVDPKMQAEINQQMIDAVENQSAGRMAWFMSLNLDKKSELGQLQERMKSGTLKPDDLKRLRQWGENQSLFVKDVADALSLTPGQVTSRLTDEALSTALAQQTPELRNRAILTGRQQDLLVENSIEYNAGAMKTYTSAYSDVFKDFGGSDVVGEAISVLGSQGYDWAGILQGSVDSGTLQKAIQALETEDPTRFGKVISKIKTKQVAYQKAFNTHRAAGEDVNQAKRNAAIETDSNNVAIQQMAASIEQETYNPNHPYLNTQVSEPTMKQVKESVKHQQEKALQRDPTYSEVATKHGTIGVIYKGLGVYSEEAASNANRYAEKVANDSAAMQSLNGIFSPFEKKLWNLLEGGVGMFGNFMGLSSGPETESLTSPSTTSDSSSMSGTVGMSTQQPTRREALDVNLVSVGSQQLPIDNLLASLSLQGGVNG